MRRRNWDARLLAWANRVVGKPFAWGVTDCGTLMRQAHEVMHGENVLRWPAYKSKRGALAAKRRLGGLPAALEAAAHAIGRRFAGTGDVVLLEHEGEYGMGVIVGADVVGTYPGHPVTLVALSLLPADATFWRVA